MSKRFNITVVTEFKGRDGKDRKTYTRCGSAFLNQINDGTEAISLKFDFIPTAAPCQTIEFVWFEPKTKEEGRPVIQ